MRLFLLSVLFATVAAGMPATAQVYRWVDERGVVNYTSLPPAAGVQVTRLDLPAPRVNSLPEPPRQSTLPPPAPPAASAPPGDVDRATVEALGRALAARDRCVGESRAQCATSGKRAPERATAARPLPLLSELHAP